MTDFSELKQAILDNNMSAVCRAYEGLTGDSIKPQKKSRGRPGSPHDAAMLPPAPPPATTEIQALQEQIAELQKTFQATVATAPAQVARQRPKFGGGANRFDPNSFKGVREPGEERINDNVQPTPRGSIPRDKVEVVPNDQIPPPPR